MKFGRFLAVAVLLAVCGVPLFGQAAPCSPDSLRQALPAGMKIATIPTFRGRGLSGLVADGLAAVKVSADPAAEAKTCLVTGTVTTNPKTGKTAGFAALLPEKARWNGKFLFIGCGGNCGNVSISGSELALAARGYTVWKTDDGHDEADPNWSVQSPGVLNQDTVDDFSFRAVHATTLAGKAFVANFYAAAKPGRAYYQGCSDGGREGMVSAARYPDDFDGLLVGAPYFDTAGQNLAVSQLTVQLRYPDGNLSGAKMKLASQIAMDQCDAADGVKDHLIQNPALCAFNPARDLPRCAAGQNQPDCYTQHQIESLSVILTAMTDERGNALHPGYSVSDMTDGRDNLAMWTAVDPMPEHPESPTPWGDLTHVGPGKVPFNALVTIFSMAKWVYAGAPGVDPLHNIGFTFTGDEKARIAQFHAVSAEATTKKAYARMNVASADFPGELDQALAQNRKILLYHGLSDGLISPFRTIQYFEELAKRHGGYQQLGKKMRFFAVPGMAHCQGGPGPNNFGQGGQPVSIDAQNDALTALETWVEKDQAPESLIATHQGQDAATPVQGRENSSENQSTVTRTMPLCVFPTMAHYQGAGDVNDAHNWSCPAGDTSMEKIGYDGIQAGADAPLFTGTADHTRTGQPIGLAPRASR